MIVDAHQHFWNLETGSYPWLTPESGVLHRTYGPADLLPHLEAAGVERTVLVQAADSLEETEALLAHAEQHDFIAGVVGWLPLMELGDTLDRYGEHVAFKGVRHLIHDEPDPDWLVREPVLGSLGRLAERGLSFDVVSDLPRHLEHVETIATRYPDLRLVVDHLSKPRIRDGEWEPWASGLAGLAALPNVYVKVSGLVSEADHEAWTVEDLRPYVEYAVELFGPERLMCGSDWPVVLQAADYATVWAVHSALLGGTDRDKVLGDTAVEFYRL